MEIVWMVLVFVAFNNIFIVHYSINVTYRNLLFLPKYEGIFPIYNRTDDKIPDLFRNIL